MPLASNKPNTSAKTVRVLPVWAPIYTGPTTSHSWPEGQLWQSSGNRSPGGLLQCYRTSSIRSSFGPRLCLWPQLNLILGVGQIAVRVPLVSMPYPACLPGYTTALPRQRLLPGGYTAAPAVAGAGMCSPATETVHTDGSDGQEAIFTRRFCALLADSSQIDPSVHPDTQPRGPPC